MIIEEYGENLFISRFEDYKRVSTLENPNGNFSYKGLRALYGYLDEAYDEENPLKLDVIALCCDFTEYKNLQEYLNEFYTTEEINERIEDITENKGEDITKEEREQIKKYFEAEISNNTTLIKFEEDLDEGFIIQNF